MSYLYFYVHNGVKQNVASEEELISLAKSGIINRDTLIWRKGYSDWKTLAESEIDTSFLPPPVNKTQPQNHYTNEIAEAPKSIENIKDKFDKYFVENIKKAFDYRGRTSRASYWYFLLFYFLIMIVLVLFASVLGDIGGVLVLIYSLASIVVQIPLTVRRMHDVGHSGWWLLVPIVPLIFSLQPTQLIKNQYGEVPLY